jgi:hypothetical protein
MLIIRHNLFIFDNNYLHQWLFIIILIIIFISLFLFNCQFEYKRQHRFLFENSFIAIINSTLKCILALIIILSKVIIRHPTFTLNIVHACVSSWQILARIFVVIWHKMDVVVFHITTYINDVQWQLYKNQLHF